ncbi:MAG: stage 0 sporulation family protein [Deltaproteobacteria bacterium]|nr:stage 0 sporulation family protein [Deltaproteobacteria bacterium]
MPKVVGVRFKRACKIYDFDVNNLELKTGEQVVVETQKGMGLGWVARSPLDKPAPASSKQRDETNLVQPLKKVIRKATGGDRERFEFNKEMEDEAAAVCRKEIAKHGLSMKLVNVEYLFDSSKVIFSFISENRVDFRDLVKDMANELHTRIEMRQIGVRDEAKMLGGVGPCGRMLCCSTHLVDFEPVSVKMAKEQNISLNPAKLSGVCGRLMCCLSYEASQDACDSGSNCCHSHKPEQSQPSSLPGA